MISGPNALRASAVERRASGGLIGHSCFWAKLPEIETDVRVIFSLWRLTRPDIRIIRSWLSASWIFNLSEIVFYRDVTPFSMSKVDGRNPRQRSYRAVDGVRCTTDPRADGFISPFAVRSYAHAPK